MASDRGVTLRAQWLGQILREFRERKGLTLKDAGEYLQRDSSTVSRCEAGIYPIRRIEAAAMLDLYGVRDDRQRGAVLELAGEIFQTGWWERYFHDNVFGSTIDYVWLENRSHELRMFSPLVVPGLLQTAEYARALIETVNRDARKSQVDRWIELRMERQRILERDEAVRLSAILDEAVLRRPVGGADVIAAQVRRLAEMARRDTIDIRVLPFSLGAHASPEGAFTLLKMADPFPEVAHIESSAGSIYLEAEDVDRFVDQYDWLHEHSLSADDSAALLADVEKNLS